MNHNDSDNYYGTDVEHIARDGSYAAQQQAGFDQLFIAVLAYRDAPTFTTHEVAIWDRALSLMD